MRALALFCVALAASAAAPKELRFSIPGDPKSFDPLHLEESNSQMLRDLTAGVLVKVNRISGQLEPDLAEAWEIKDGGRTIVFHLRAGLVFSDGTPLTSADVVKSNPWVLAPLGLLMLVMLCLELLQSRREVAL